MSAKHGSGSGLNPTVAQHFWPSSKSEAEAVRPRSQRCISSPQVSPSITKWAFRNARTHTGRLARTHETWP